MFSLLFKGPFAWTCSTKTPYAIHPTQDNRSDSQQSPNPPTLRAEPNAQWTQQLRAVLDPFAAAASPCPDYLGLTF